MHLSGFTLLLLMLHLSPMRATEPSLRELRSLYIQAPLQEESCRQLLRMADRAESPVIAGYKGAALMVSAKYVFSPITKLRCFKKGKDLLQNAIGADSSSIELRFLRYTIQQNAPRFLGYHEEMKQDRDFIIRKGAAASDPQLNAMIRSTVLEQGGKP